MIEGSLLHPGFIDRIVDAAFASNPDEERAALIEERARLTTEISNLATAIAAGGDIRRCARHGANRKMGSQYAPRRDARGATKCGVPNATADFVLGGTTRCVTWSRLSDLDRQSRGPRPSGSGARVSHLGHFGR